MRKHITGAPARASRAFVAHLAQLQRANDGQPVTLSPAEWAALTGIPEPDQIAVRQSLMRAGRLRLSVVGNAWAYALEEGV